MQGFSVRFRAVPRLRTEAYRLMMGTCFFDREDADELLKENPSYSHYETRKTRHAKTGMTEVMPVIFVLRSLPSPGEPQMMLSRRGAGSEGKGAYFVYVTAARGFCNEVLEASARRNYLPPMPFAAK